MKELIEMMLQAVKDAEKPLDAEHKKDLVEFRKDQGSLLAQLVGLYHELLPERQLVSRLLLYIRHEKVDHQWALLDAFNGQADVMSWDIETLNVRMDEMLESVKTPALAVWLSGVPDPLTGVYGAYVRQLNRPPILFLIRDGLMTSRGVRGAMCQDLVEKFLKQDLGLAEHWKAFIELQGPHLRESKRKKVEALLSEYGLQVSDEQWAKLSAAFLDESMLRTFMQHAVMSLGSQPMMESQELLERTLQVLKAQHDERAKRLEEQAKEMEKEVERKTKRLKDTLARVEMMSKGLQRRATTLEQDLNRTKAELRQAQSGATPAGRTSNLGAALDALF